MNWQGWQAIVVLTVEVDAGERRAVGAPKRVDQDWLVKIAIASAGARQILGGRWGKWRLLQNDATTPKIQSSQITRK